MSFNLPRRRLEFLRCFEYDILTLWRHGSDGIYNAVLLTARSVANQCTCHISQNATCRTKYAYFCAKVVYCGILGRQVHFGISAIGVFLTSLGWHHNDRDGVSYRQPHDCLLNRLLGRRSKKTSKLHVTGLCGGNARVTGEFSAQRTSNAENVSIWWRHHADIAGNLYR